MYISLKSHYGKVNTRPATLIIISESMYGAQHLASGVGFQFAEGGLHCTNEKIQQSVLRTVLRILSPYRTHFPLTTGPFRSINSAATTIFGRHKASIPKGCEMRSR